MKIKRIQDKKLLNEYRGRRCCVCHKEPTCAHHIKTKGSGGSDIENNLVALCFIHHEEIHKKGLNAFVGKYPLFEITLEEKGWKHDEFRGKWINTDSK